jgi:hypothetical protein
LMPKICIEVLLSATTYEFISSSPRLHPVCIAQASLSGQDAARKSNNSE